MGVEVPDVHQGTLISKEYGLGMERVLESIIEVVLVD